eukprot:TRINITY_DN17641_c0_g1_i1.p1 TRINITY_DN17641_c0_g1~~TRINITY_DN17641_c0_g1_i1.p1  ORF type:complete len:372 (+),score=116.07 TRINITY_DN17641_c0_g1_i1:189-1304(+)
MEAILEKAAVIEVGSFHTKVGFAGESCPRCIVQTPAGLTSSSAQSRSTSCQKFLRRVFFNLLQVNPTDTPVFLIEGLLTTDVTRQVLVDTMLAKLSVPCVTPLPHSLAAVHAAGLDTGLVLDVGHRHSCCIAVVDGAPLYHTIQTAPTASGTLDAVIQEANPDFSPALVQETKARVCSVQPQEQQAEQELKIDGQQVHGLAEVCAAPEQLFRPECGSESVQELVLGALMGTPRELRVHMAANIVVCGGGSMLPGFCARLEQELPVCVLEARFSRLDHLSEQRAKQSFRVAAAVFEPNCMGWAGGSILGSVKGVNWMSCGRVSAEQYMTVRREDGSVPRTLMPCWSDLNGVLEEEEEREGTPHKSTRWQVGV